MRTVLGFIVGVVVVGAMFGTHHSVDSMGDFFNWMNDGVVGSGERITTERKVGDFTKLHAAIGTVTVEVGKPIKVTVEVDDNLQELIATHAEQGTLTIKSAHSFSTSKPAKILVQVPKLSSLTASGIAHVHAPALGADVFALGCQGASHITIGALKAKQLELAAFGAAHVTVAGDCDQVTAKLSGACHLAGAKLRAQSVKVNASGACHAHLHASKSASGKASGASQVRVSGNPAERDISESAAANVRIGE